MTIKERIKQAIDNMDCDVDNIEKVIALAYYIGREDAAKTTSDMYNDVLAAQIKRANGCRYHNMAMDIQGGIHYVYTSDYSGDMTKTFGGDETNV